MNKKFLFLTKASISKKLKSKWFLGVNIFLFVLLVSFMNIDSVISFFGGEFTEDIEMTPREMAEFAFENGFYTESGTSWSLWTEGTALLGLKGEELPLDENRMKAELDAGGLIVCSMRPGDFTTTGHFILIRGYDEDGFYVNDPNRRSTSGKVWDFETLQYQIRNLWGLRKAF